MDWLSAPGLKQLLIIIPLIYLAFFILFILLSNTVMFRPPPATYEMGELLTPIRLKNGNTLIAFYSPNPEAEYTILFSHGNAEDLGMLHPYLQLLNQMGYSVFAYDYEGYGLSTGRPSESHTYEDIDAAYDYLRNTLEIPPEKIVIYGRSLGTGPSVYLASRHPAHSLILESPFVSSYRVQTIIPLFPFDKYPNLERINQIKMPLLVIHGSQDGVIPIWHGKKIYEAYMGPKLAYWVYGADHNTVVQVGGQTYWTTLHNFIYEAE